MKAWYDEDKKKIVVDMEGEVFNVDFPEGTRVRDNIIFENMTIVWTKNYPKNSWNKKEAR